MIIPQLPSIPPASFVVPTLAQISIPIYVPPPERQDSPARQDSSGWIYNVTTSRNLKASQRLQVIIDEAVNLAARRGLPKSGLSLTLIDVKTGEIAGYQQQKLRYPASVAKLFWMAAFYSQVERGSISNEAAFASDLYRMIQFSDNNAASRILDAITNTESGGRLSGEAYQNWLNNRNQINAFFQSAGYQNLRLNQKVYPISSLGLNLPRGRDLQMRGNPRNPLRNQIKSSQPARLLYDIFTNRSISPTASQKMAQLLTKNQNLNSLPREELLLRVLLPSNVNFAGKAGWTSSEIHGAAFISTPDRQAEYILTVLGSDRAFVSRSTILSEISRLVFERMTR